MMQTLSRARSLCRCLTYLWRSCSNLLPIACPLRNATFFAFILHVPLHTHTAVSARKKERNSLHYINTEATACTYVCAPATSSEVVAVLEFAFRRVGIFSKSLKDTRPETMMHVRMYFCMSMYVCIHTCMYVWIR